MKQQQLDNPGQFIRQWRKFSQGLAGKPSPYQDPVFHFEGQAWHGMPLYLGRSIRGYLQVGDEVLCFGHIRGKLDYQEASVLDPEYWLQPGLDRPDWAGAKDQTLLGVRCMTQVHNYTSHAYGSVEGEAWIISLTCLALPIELHYERRRQLQSEGRWIEWADRPELAVQAYSGAPLALAIAALNGPGGEDG